MAPDVTRPLRATSTASNSASPAQASPHLSRRTSSAMAPPPVPQNSSMPNSPRPPTVAMDTSGYGGTTGPIRHPRPLTAAELHLELEKEQESIVNRLTRELSALRAQTVSVASTTSSTSELFTTNQSDSHLYTYQFGITPTSARRHRSSSNLSSRSARSARDTLANSASVTSVSGVAAPRDRDRERDNNAIHSHQASSRPSMELPRPDMSRQNSMSGVYRSTSYNNSHSNTQQQPHSTSATSPAAWNQPHNSSRHSISSTYSNLGQQPVSETNYTRSPSSNTALAASRYEEAAIQRQELEAVKRENEALKMRIRELERSLSGQAQTVSTSGSAPVLNIHSSNNTTAAATVNGINGVNGISRVSS